MSLKEHQISLQEAAELTKNYRKLPLGKLGPILSGLKGVSLSCEALKAVIEQPNCVTVRFYYAVKLNIPPIFTLVVVGVDANGNDLTDGYILDKTHNCPPICGTNNELNS